MATFTGSTGIDLFAGSDTEADVFRFAPANLQSLDTISGGAGGFEDILRITLGGSILAAAFANVGGIERIDLPDSDTSLTLPAALVASAGGTLVVNGGTGTDSILATSLVGTTLRMIVTTGSGGADVVATGDGADQVTLQGLGAGRRLVLNGGDDTVTAAIANLNGADSISGGAGRDRLVLTGTGAVSAAALAGVASVEEIQLPGLAGVTLQVSDAMANQADADVLTVIGNGQDQAVDASGVLAGRGVVFLAGSGQDSFTGGAGADLVETGGSVSGTLGAGADTLRLLTAGAAGSALSGGAGNDSILVAKRGEWVLGAGLTGFETVELLVARIRLTLNATQGMEVLGSSGADHVLLGGAGQAFYGFEGDDTVVLTAAMLPGVALHGGDQTGRDTIILTGGGTIDLRRAFITGFERMEVETGGRGGSVFLANQPMDVVLRGAANVYFGSAAGQNVFGSSGDETFVLGAAGQALLARGGDDVIHASPAALGTGTMIDGGGGLDRLVISGTGTADLRNGALVQAVEVIDLGDTFGLLLDAAPGRHVLGTVNGDNVSTLAGDITGDLEAGDDTLEITFGALLAAAAPGVMTGGAGIDTIRVVDDFGVAGEATLGARFASFEILDLGTSGGDRALRIAESAARTILYGAAVNTTVQGGAGDETFRLGANAGAAFGNGGNDTIEGGGAADRLDGGAGNDSITGGAGADVILGGLGRDTMRGGDGADSFVIQDAAELADWAINPRTIAAATFPMASEIDDLVILATGSATLDFATHAISNIDRIRVGPGLELTLILTQSMMSTANFTGNDNNPRIGVIADGAPTSNLVIDVTSLTLALSLTTAGALDGHDRILGGPGRDSLEGAGGNDTLKGGAGFDTLLGGAGNDELRGEAENDSISGGAGADSIWGDDGADRIALGAGDGASDRVAYNSPTNGSADINTTLPVSTADLITEFIPRANAADTLGDWIAVSRAGLGLNGGNDEIVLANGETWNATLYSVFVVHSLDTLGDAAGAADFGDLALVAAGVNSDAGAKSGFIPGRTVLFALSNGEGVATRQTGLYRWVDDGDGVLESADDLRLLAVIDGVSTASFSTETIVLA